MADKRLLIELFFKRSGSGATDAGSDLKKTKDSANQAGQEVERTGNIFTRFFKRRKDEINEHLKDLSRYGDGLKKTFRATLDVMGSTLRVARNVGIGVAGALALAVRQGNQFSKSMAMVNTMLSGGDIKVFSDQVLKLSGDLGVATDELSNGLYQALSAGVPESNALSFLETAAKAAIAGATDTVSAVDVLTTALNAWKIDASKTAEVSDLLFKTVKMGKTTFGELGSSIAQVAPLAAASGVEIEQVLAAVATLTKQGTPTAQAMTQIRAAIIALNDVLGDGWSDTKTFQEGVVELTKRAGGSNTALKDMVGSVEALAAVLATTGDNAEGAMKDLKGMGSAAGETAEAVEKMSQSRHWDRLGKTVQGVWTKIGTVVDEALRPAVDRVTVAIAKWRDNEGFFERLRARIQEIANIAVGLWDAINNGQAEEVFSGVGELFIIKIQQAGVAFLQILIDGAVIVGKVLAQAIWNNLVEYLGPLIKAAAFLANPAAGTAAIIGGEVKKNISGAVQEEGDPLERLAAALEKREEKAVLNLRQLSDQEGGRSTGAEHRGRAGSAPTATESQATPTNAEGEPAFQFFIGDQSVSSEQFKAAGEAAREASDKLAEGAVALVESSELIREGAGQVVSTAAESAMAVTEASKATEEDIKASAVIVRTATEDATGKVSGAMIELSSTLGNGFTKVTRLIHDQNVVIDQHRQTIEVLNENVRAAMAAAQAAKDEAVRVEQSVKGSRK